VYATSIGIRMGSVGFSKQAGGKVRMNTAYQRSLIVDYGRLERAAYRVVFSGEHRMQVAGNESTVRRGDGIGQRPERVEAEECRTHCGPGSGREDEATAFKKRSPPEEYSY
jgi:hypothetical protein